MQDHGPMLHHCHSTIIADTIANSQRLDNKGHMSFIIKFCVLQRNAMESKKVPGTRGLSVNGMYPVLIVLPE
jgi:hypothetical protein